MEKGRRVVDVFLAGGARYLGMFMSSCQFDVLGLGNAIVDVISLTGDDFFAARGCVEGTMTLIDEAPPRPSTRPWVQQP